MLLKVVLKFKLEILLKKINFIVPTVKKLIKQSYNFMLEQAIQAMLSLR